MEEQGRPTLTLNEEQREWVREYLDLDPGTLSDAQKGHIIKYWENKPYNEFVRQHLDAKGFTLGKKVSKTQVDEYYAEIRRCDEEWTEEKAREDAEYKGLFPRKQLAPEEFVIQEELIKAVQHATDMKAKLFTSIMDIAEAEWVIEGIAVKEGITLLIGDAGVGKTSLMLQLIASAKEGKGFVGLKVSKVTTLLVEQDENPALLRSHIERMLPILPSLRLLEVPTKTVLWNTDKGQFTDKTLEELIQYSGLANLVIIDSLTSLGIDDINHPKCSIVFDRLRDLSRRWKCAFIIIHHLNRGGDVMGNKLIHAKVDVMLRLQKGKLIYEKLRGEYPNSVVHEGKEKPYLPIEQDGTTLVFRPDRQRRFMELKEAGIPRAEVITIIMGEYGGSRDAVSKAYDRAKE